MLFASVLSHQNNYLKAIVDNCINLYEIVSVKWLILHFDIHAIEPVCAGQGFYVCFRAISFYIVYESQKIE
jgi:hypothetical protein